MSITLVLRGYDLSDEGPHRTVNEDATLVRDDLGLYAVADGAGGRGLGDVAANLALRSIENYIGATVRRSHDRPDYDLLGIPEQARRLSSAVHQAHQNIVQIAGEDATRKGMASTAVAILLAPRTRQIHIAHVGNSRCYRIRHGRLELMTNDHTISTEILERRPNTPDRVLANLPRNSIVSALGMDQEFRVSMRSLDLLSGDRFLLCTDGLTSAVDTATIWLTARELEAASVIASELLGHALSAGTQDNVSILVADCREQTIHAEMETRPYNEIPVDGQDTITMTPFDQTMALQDSREITDSELDEELGMQLDGPAPEVIERERFESEAPTLIRDTEDPPSDPLPSAPYTLSELDLELDEFPEN